MYGGYIQLKSQQKKAAKDITIPYVGIVGNQRELPIYGHETPFLTNSTDATYVYGPDDVYEYKRTGGTPPIFIFYLANPTKVIKAPIYDAETNKQLGYAFTDVELSARSSTENPGFALQWKGSYTSTTSVLNLPITKTVTPGKYRIGFNALKWLGNPKDKKDWENWTSSVIEVK